MNTRLLFLVLVIINMTNLTKIFAQTNPLVNTWKFEEKSLPVVSEIFIQRIRNANPEQAKQLEANPEVLTPIIKAIEYTFKDNGVYEVNSPQGVQTGTWKIDNNNLITQITGGPERKDSIILIVGNKMVLFNREVKKAVEYGLAKTDAGQDRSESKRITAERENEQKEYLLTKAIKNVAVVDVHAGKLLERHTVVWKEGKITSVAPDNKVTLPADAVIIDGQGKYLLPGLIDTHIHFFQSAGLYTRPDGLNFTKIVPYEKDQQWIKDNHANTMKRYIGTGVTTVVDVGGPLYNFHIRDSINPQITAPNTIVTGPLISTYSPPNLDKNDPPIIKVNNADEARALVRKQVPFKPTFIKIWYVVRPGEKAEQFSAEVGAAIDEAHKNNLKVAVHATEYATAKQAIALGADILVHSVDDTVLDDSFLQTLKAKKIVYIPTLQVTQQAYRIFKQEFDFTPHELAWSDPTQLSSLFDLRHLDPKELNGFNYKVMRSQFSIPSKGDSILLLNLKRVTDYGITVATGTDAGNPGVAHGASYLRELLLMQKAGLSNFQVLKASTIDAAKAFRVENRYGSIEQGKAADFLLLNENPLKTLQALEKIEATYSRGYGYKPFDLLPKTVDELAKAEVNAYNAGNIDAFVARYSPDAEIYNLSNPTKPIAVGSKQIREIWGGFFKQFPNLHCHVTTRTIIGNKCTAVESITGVGPEPSIGVGIYYFNLKTGLIDKVYFVD